MKNIPIQFKILIGIVILIVIISLFTKLYNSFVSLYNNTKELELSYNKISQEQISNYDGYYLMFMDKQEITKINKETFIEVTDIVMSNRKDGINVAWKWTQENQQIPYEEFTIFYKQLYSFISERCQDNMSIERSKQSIVQYHNLLLSKYPNNLYNKVLKIEFLVYKPGYISNSTKNKFK